MDIAELNKETVEKSILHSDYKTYQWYFVTKIVLTYCTVRKNCHSDREKLLRSLKAGQGTDDSFI